MTAKLVVPRALARQDVEEAVVYYAREAGAEVALGFIDALEQAYAALAAYPAAGSLRYAFELNLPGLRCWTLRSYPYLVFYRDVPAQVDVWRVLHGQRDIPVWMPGPDENSDL